LSFKQEQKLLVVAPELLRVLVVLILDTGLRSGREALALKWEDVNFADESIRINQSKTLAGIRTVPMSGRCSVELQRWFQVGKVCLYFVLDDFPSAELDHQEQPEQHRRTRELNQFSDGAATV